MLKSCVGKGAGGRPANRDGAGERAPRARLPSRARRAPNACPASCNRTRRRRMLRRPPRMRSCRFRSFSHRGKWWICGRRPGCRVAVSAQCGKPSRARGLADCHRGGIGPARGQPRASWNNLLSFSLEDSLHDDSHVLLTGGVQAGASLGLEHQGALAQREGHVRAEGRARCADELQRRGDARRSAGPGFGLTRADLVERIL